MEYDEKKINITVFPNRFNLDPLLCILARNLKMHQMLDNLWKFYIIQLVWNLLHQANQFKQKLISIYSFSADFFFLSLNFQSYVESDGIGSSEIKSHLIAK